MSRTPSIKVRGYEDRDLDDICLLFDGPAAIAGTLQIPYRSRDYRQARYQPDPNIFSLVAEMESRVVGMGSLVIANQPRRRFSAGLGMAVSDAFQNRGVGRALMEALMDLADNWLGLKRVELVVFSDNEAGIHLYEKFGFFLEGTASRYALRNGEYVDAHYMGRLHE